jgi:DNA-binding SARP family transcriptional activator
LLPEFNGLVVKPATLLLDPMQVQIDVREFELKSAEGTLPALERAAELYVGDFLQGFSLREEPFEQWRASEKQRLQDLVDGI